MDETAFGGLEVVGGERVCDATESESGFVAAAVEGSGVEDDWGPLVREGHVKVGSWAWAVLPMPFQQLCTGTASFAMMAFREARERK